MRVLGRVCVALVFVTVACSAPLQEYEACVETMRTGQTQHEVVRVVGKKPDGTVLYYSPFWQRVVELTPEQRLNRMCPLASRSLFEVPPPPPGYRGGGIE